MEYVNDAYVLTNPISDHNIKEMRINMEESDMALFDAFLERNWGIKVPKMNVGTEVQDLGSAPKVQEAVPVSASTDAVKKVATKTKTANRTPQELAKLARMKQELANRAKQKPVAKKDVSKEQPKPQNRSSILGNIDLEDDEI